MKQGEVSRAKSSSDPQVGLPLRVDSRFLQWSARALLWGSASCVLVSSYLAAEELPGVVGAQLRHGWCQSWVTALPVC